jgi:hypothetical protein
MEKLKKMSGLGRNEDKENKCHVDESYTAVEVDLCELRISPKCVAPMTMRAGIKMARMKMNIGMHESAGQLGRKKKIRREFRTRIRSQYKKECHLRRTKPKGQSDFATSQPKPLANVWLGPTIEVFTDQNNVRNSEMSTKFSRAETEQTYR